MTQAQPTASVVSGSRVLVTGITGFIATHIAKQFLARGYRVRGTVRDLTKAAWLTDELFKDETSKGALELIRVPDMKAPGAYTAALKDISIVIDTVMPWPNSQDPDACIAATVASSQSLLEATLAEKAVKRVVVTSSLVAASMFQAGTTEVVGRDTYNEMAEKILESLPSDAGELREFIAYCVAKTHAEKALWKFVNERRPAFSVSTVNAGMVLGKPLNAAHMGRSAVVHPSGIVTDLFVNGVAGGNLANHQSHFVDVHDIALLHVATALDPDVKNERVQAWGTFNNWTTVLQVLHKLYPDQRLAAEAPDQVSEVTITTDMSLALHLLKKWGGQDGFRPLEVMVKDTIDPVAERV